MLDTLEPPGAQSAAGDSEEPMNLGHSILGLAVHVTVFLHRRPQLNSMSYCEPVHIIHRLYDRFPLKVILGYYYAIVFLPLIRVPAFV